jgi:glycosyltransferase involved in cell wall biosynthesis
LRRLVKAAPRVLCIGSAAREAYQRLGAAPEKLFVLPYLCDTTRYQAIDAEVVAEFRRQRQWDGKFVYLFSGQFTERKGVDLLLTAFARVARERSDVALALLGDGPLRAGLLEGLEPEVRRRVQSPGHVAQADLPAWFAAADAFVFPSRHDGWGVVVNEACAAGLPVVTMDSVGAAHDLVVDGQNGFVLSRDDAEGLYRRMRWLAEHPREARKFGERSRELVAKFSLERGIELLEAAIRPASEAQRTDRLPAGTKAMVAER